MDPKTFAGHSLRPGGLNHGRRSGNSKYQSKLHGRWRSDAIEAYDELGTDEQLAYVHGGDVKEGRWRGPRKSGRTGKGNTKRVGTLKHRLVTGGGEPARG